MSNVGLGVILGWTGGNEETVTAYQAAVGRTITAARLDEDVRKDGAIVLEFKEGGSLNIWDGGRSCCETRYITTDDDLTDLIGKQLVKIETKEGPEVEDDWGTREQMFVEIITHDGTNVILTTHNEHNGYYGGFWLQLAFSNGES